MASMVSTSCIDDLTASLSLELIGKISVKDLAEKVAIQLSTALQAVQDASGFQNGPHDQGVVEAVQKVQESVNEFFMLGRAFIIKAHSLASYIYSEKLYTIKAIEDGNAEELKAYLEEVLSKSQACQKSLQELIAFNEYNGQKAIDEQMKTGLSKGVSAQMIVAGVAVMIPAGPAFPAIGSIGGLIFSIHSAVAYLRQKEMVAYCERAIKAIQEMKSNLLKIEESLKTVNAALKAEIDHNYEDISDCKLNKLSKKRGVAQRALKQKVQEVAEGANRLKEYCEPLKESKNLQEFIQRIASTS